MSNLCKICLYFALICIFFEFNEIRAFSMQYRGNTQSELQPGNCYYEELELLVPLNETLLPTDYEDYCVRVHCREDYVLEIKHCERIMLHSECRMTPYDYTKPYPDCCYRVICKNH